MESRAAARAAAKAAIHQALEVLSPEDRLVVLEDTLFAERAEAPSAAPTVPEAPAPAVSSVPTAELEAASATEEKPLWGRILEWCRAHPTHSGYHEVRAAAVALLPQLTPRAAWQRVYVEVKRKAKTGAGRQPLFDFEPGNKRRFRLVEAGEAQAKGVARKRS